MSLFGGLFRSDSPDEKAKKEFPKMEKRVWKNPCRDYDEVLDVYLSGSTKMYLDIDGGRQEVVVRLPEFQNREKAVQLIRAALDPSKCRSAGKDRPNQLMHPLAILTSDEQERYNLVREIFFGPGSFGQYAKPTAWYIYSRGLMDQYCKTVEERAEIFRIITLPGDWFPEEKKAYQYGMYEWRWNEVYNHVGEEERKKQGNQELVKMLHSKDPDVRERTARYLRGKDAGDFRRLKELEKEMMQLYAYAQDELGMQLEDEEGNKLEIRDNVIRRV